MGLAFLLASLLSLYKAHASDETITCLLLEKLNENLLSN